MEEGKEIAWGFFFFYNRCEISVILKKNCLHKYILVFHQCIANSQGLIRFITAVISSVLVKGG